MSYPYLHPISLIDDDGIGLLNENEINSLNTSLKLAIDKMRIGFDIYCIFNERIKEKWFWRFIFFEGGIQVGNEIVIDSVRSGLF